MKAGIIGLGLIGKEWAKHLNNDGILVAAWNRTTYPDFPKYTADIKQLIETSEIIHICLSDPPAVRTVLDSILTHLNSSHLVIQSSTIDPDSAEEFSKSVQNKKRIILKRRLLEAYQPPRKER